MTDETCIIGKDVLDVVSGKETFLGLHSPGLSLNGYKKLHIAKQ